MMVEKTNKLDRFDLRVVVGMIQMHRKLQLLNEEDIYLATLKQATTILAFVARVRQKRIKTSRDIAWDHRDRDRIGTP